MSFYENFCAICKERNISPSAAAYKAGLDKSIVSYWKKNPATIPKYETLLRISKVLSVSPEYLMGHVISNEENQSFSIAEKICTLRKQNELSQEQMAKLLGINRATLSKYETGVIVPSLAQLKKIASALGVSPGFLQGVSTELIYETVKIIDMAISSLESHKRQLLEQWSESEEGLYTEYK